MQLYTTLTIPPDCARQKVSPILKSFASELLVNPQKERAIIKSKKYLIRFRLIGKVETSMCLVLQSAAIAKRKEKVDYLRVTQEVLQTAIPRYYYCSAR